MTCVEAKFGLRIRVSSVKRKDHQVRAMGVSSAVEHIFNETAMQARTLASNRRAKAIKASHGPRVRPQSQAKERAQRTLENPKGSPKEPKVRSKVQKAQAKVKHRKRASQVLKA